MPDWSAPAKILRTVGELFSLCFAAFARISVVTCEHRWFLFIFLQSRHCDGLVVIDILIEVLRNLLLVILGLYTWEIITQLPLDWGVISRKVHSALSSYLLWNDINLITTHTPSDDALAEWDPMYNSVKRIGPCSSTFGASTRSWLLSFVPILLCKRQPRSTARQSYVIFFSLPIPSPTTSYFLSLCQT